MTPRRRLLAFAAILAATGACVDLRMRVIEARPSRPPGCAVDLFPGEKYPLQYGAFADVAYAEVRCRKRDRCIDELRRQACAVGAQGVYWSWEETRNGQTDIDAHFAVRVTGHGSSARSEWGSRGDLIDDRRRDIR